MAEEKKVATSEAKADKAPETVPVEQYNDLYNQAVDLEGRYRRLLEAYNALLDLYIAHK